MAVGDGMIIRKEYHAARKFSRISSVRKIQMQARFRRANYKRGVLWKRRFKPMNQLRNFFKFIDSWRNRGINAGYDHR